MKQVRLTGKTRKGKTRVGTFGAVWNVDPLHGVVHNPPETRLFLCSLDKKDFRWVHPTDDGDFTVEEVL